MKRHPLYSTWNSIRQRCTNPKNRGYDDYGGRGITMFDDWLYSQEAFYSWCYANGYRKELVLDRQDNDKGYNPDNCKFVTVSENNANRRSWKGRQGMLERDVEAYLVKRMKEIGGRSVKNLAVHARGFPDRTCLFPNSITAFVEVKTLTGKLTKLQSLWYTWLKEHGHRVYVVRSKKGVDALINVLITIKTRG